MKSHQQKTQALLNTQSYDYDADVNLLAYQLTHRLIHIACIFAHPTINGFNMVHNACVSTFIPIAPPGRNVTKYHNNDTNCNADAPNTKTYPCAPPTVNVKYSVAIIDPK